VAAADPHEGSAVRHRRETRGREMSTQRLLRLVLTSLVTLALMALGAPSALAQPPPNDDFDDAIVIAALPFNDTGNTEEATTAVDDPDCVGRAHTIWYSFTPAADMRIEGNTFGSDYDTTLSAYTGARGSLERIACNDDSGSLQSRIRFDAAAGVTLHFMVGSFDEAPGGNLVMSIFQAPPLPPPLVLGVTIDPTGSVSRDGVVTIHGTVTCSREASPVELFGTLRQQVGRRVTVGSFAGAVSCSGEATWSATVIGETGTYRRGSARATVAASFFDPDREELVRARADATVQLQR
jgi:hypothetical protein